MTTDKLKSYLDQQQKLCDKATAGPWQNYYNRRVVQQTLEPYPEVDVVGDVCRTDEFEDGDFIAASRATVPTLLSMVRIMAEALEKLGESPVELWPNDLEQEVEKILTTATNLIP